MNMRKHYDYDYYSFTLNVICKMSDTSQVLNKKFPFSFPIDFLKTQLNFNSHTHATHSVFLYLTSENLEKGKDHLYIFLSCL